MWARSVFWLRLAAVVWVALVVIGSSLQSTGAIPSLPKLEPWVWAFSLVLLAVDNAGTLISRGVHRRWRGRTAEIESALLTMHVQVSKHGIPFEQLGSGIFVVSPRDRFFRRSDQPLRLSRHLRYRPSNYPQQSGVAWAPGKGAVGVCWEARKPVHRNWHNLAKKWRHVDTIADDTWTRIKEETKMGFSKSEFLSIVDKYSEILAVPIWHPEKDNKLIGIMSIDRTYLESNDAFLPVLGSKETREDVVTTSSLVSRILKPTRLIDS